MRVTGTLLLACFLAGCAEGEAPLDPASLPDSEELERAFAPGELAVAPSAFKQCLRSFTPSPAAGWRHTSSRFVAALGGRVHSSQDVVVRPGSTARIDAKLAYGGALSKDLEDEWVWVFVHDCTAWRYVGYALTNDDGRATFNLAPGLTTGVYDVRLEVVGDASTVTTRLWVLPSGTHLAVFDIDGTLTTDDGEIWEEILLGHVPEAYPAAYDVTWAERSRDLLPVYLTGRPEILTGHSRAWLNARGYPTGIIRHARTAGEVLPTTSGVGTYKANFLLSLRSLGLLLDDSFGNASTDIYAYSRAAVPVTRTWIIGENAGSGGTVPVHDTWAAVASRLFGEPVVDQPGW
jgi:hypothetical protein